jgi:hypothetical protein
MNARSRAKLDRVYHEIKWYVSSRRLALLGDATSTPVSWSWTVIAGPPLGLQKPCLSMFAPTVTRFDILTKRHSQPSMTFGVSSAGDGTSNKPCREAHAATRSEFTDRLVNERKALYQDAGIIHFSCTPKPLCHGCDAPRTWLWIRGLARWPARGLRTAAARR